MAGGLPPSKGLDSEYQAREPTRWRRPDHPHALRVILVASPTACPPWQAKAGVGPVHLRLRPPAHRFERTERRGSHGHFGPQGLRRAGRSRKLFYFLRLGTVGLGGPVALVGQMEQELVAGKEPGRLPRKRFNCWGSVAVR